MAIKKGVKDTSHQGRPTTEQPLKPSISVFERDRGYLEYFAYGG